MEEIEFDVVILGSGYRESLLAVALIKAGKRVLMIERGSYLGGLAPSMNLYQLYDAFDNGEGKRDLDPKLGDPLQYNIDFCPKFLLGRGKFAKLLKYSDAGKYLELKTVHTTFMNNGERMIKVPVSVDDVSNAGLGMFQKKRFRKYLKYSLNYDENDETTFRKYDPERLTTLQVFEAFKIEEELQALAGHCIACNSNDLYLDDPYIHQIGRVQTFSHSAALWGESALVFPVFGLGVLSESCARLGALQGGSAVRLGSDVDEIIFNNDGTVAGVRTGESVFRCNQLVGDPSYFVDSGRVNSIGKVIRWIFILERPIKGIDGAHSALVTIPACFTGRQTDVFITMSSSEHRVAPENRYVAIISAFAETHNPQVELDFARKIVGRSLEEFLFVDDFYQATDDGSNEQIFITSSYDPTPHCDVVAEEVLDMLELILGDRIDLNTIVEVEQLRVNDY